MTARNDNSAAVAAQFGISPKALRLYERLGMLKPLRTRAGWRVYSAGEIAALHVILALKRLGLPLARIAELMRSGEAEIGTLLDVHEEMLAESRREIDHQLTLIRIARERLKGHDASSAQSLADLVQRVSATVVRWTPELDAVALKSLPPEQQACVRPRDEEPAVAAARSEMWEEIMAALDAVGLQGDPASEEALAVGRRLAAFYRGLCGGDKGVWNTNARFWQQAFGDPESAEQLAPHRDRHAFIGAVFGELQRRGEIRF